VNINSIDIGTAFLTSNQDRTQSSTVPGAVSLAALSTDLASYYKGYGVINQQQTEQSRTYHSIQLALNRRLSGGLAVGFNDTIGLYDRQSVAPRLQHNADGTITTRADQSKADELLGNNNPQRHVARATFVWQTPKLTNGGSARQVLNHLLSDWTISGIISAASGTAYTITPSYTSAGANVNITGSPDYAPRVVITGDPGSGCSSDPLKQFNTSAFSGPQPGSDGLESGNSYLRGCFISQMDMSINRRIRLPKGISAELRMDVFNLFNQAGITNRNTTMTMANPTSASTITNLPFDSAGNVVTSRSLPRGAGFGVATAYQNPRTMQMQLRFSF
jgi:hypothetical protein